MRTLTAFILFFAVTNCFSQTDLGIGIVSINFDDKTILHFYNDTSEKQAAKTIKFFNDSSINSWNIRNLDKQKEWLKPQVLWLDYSTFDFRCKTQTDKYFQVIVNNENGQMLWLRKSKLTRFVTWETYLKEMFGVGRLSDQKQKIRKLPNDSSEEIKYKV